MAEELTKDQKLVAGLLSSYVFLARQGQIGVPELHKVMASRFLAGLNENGLLDDFVNRVNWERTEQVADVVTLGAEGEQDLLSILSAREKEVLNAVVKSEKWKPRNHLPGSVFVTAGVTGVGLYNGISGTTSAVLGIIAGLHYFVLRYLATGMTQQDSGAYHNMALQELPKTVSKLLDDYFKKKEELRGIER